MKVSCPQCGTAYRLPTGGLKGGQRVRCRRCSLVFDPPKAPPARPGASAAPAPVASATAPARPGAHAGEQDAPAVGRDPTPGTPVRLPAPVGPGVSEAAALADRLEPEVDAGVPPEEAAAPEAAPREDPAARASFGSAFDDDPFRDVDLDVPPGGPAPLEVEEPRGTSAIRAQSGRGAAPEGGAPEASDLTGWLVRTEDGVVRPFRDLDSIRAWMEAHPGVGVQVSGDGEHWRAPETLLARDVPFSHPAATPTPSLRTGTTTALRPGARRPSSPDGPGLGWSLAALGSTVLLFAVVALNVQRMGLADLSPWVPFGAVGFAELVPDRVPAADAAQGAAPDGFSEAVRAAERAQAEGRLVEAAVAWQRALAVREDPAALAALVEVYERLGEAGRARDARRRLAAIRPAEE